MTSSVRGFALPTLMVMLALTSIATLLALRNLWVNEQVLNAQADQLRTQHKAEAVLPVALTDILGTGTNKDGSINPRHTAGNATQTHVFFPNSMVEYNMLRQRLGTNTCSAGICAPHALNTNATTASYRKTQTATAMDLSNVETPYGDNSAWYWVEVFPQSNTDTFVYRITALTHGVLPSSSTVLQAIWARHTLGVPIGQWHSWHVLHD